MANIDSYSQEEFQSAYSLLLQRLVFHAKPKPQDHPQAILLGGQSGAGKTTLHQIAQKHFDGNVIIINGDEYRSRHPRYRELDATYGPEAVSHTAAWSGAMTEALIESLSDKHYNLVIEGTLRTSEIPLRTATLLRSKGYAVHLALMAVKPEISLISCQIRYEQLRLAGTIPRATDPKHHQLIVDAIADNLVTLEDSDLFESISLYDRSRKRLFPTESSIRAGKRASDALRQILFGPWTAEEQEHYDKLQQLFEELRSSSSPSSSSSSS